MAAIVFLGVEGAHFLKQRHPRHHLLHLSEEPIAAHHLALVGILELGKRQLLMHGSGLTGGFKPIAVFCHSGPIAGLDRSAFPIGSSYSALAVAA